MQQWQEQTRQRLSGKKILPKYWEFPEQEKGNIHKHCAYCIDINCAKTLNIDFLFTEYDVDSSCGVISCSWNCGAKYHACKSTEHLMICRTYEEPDEFDWIIRGVSNDFESIKIKTGRQKKAALAKQQQVMETKSKCIGDLLMGPERLIKKTSLAQEDKVVPDPPLVLLDDTSVTINKLSLELNIEKEARHQNKPINMYTFVCGKSFRRDEYMHHMKNVHDDIMGGLTNWIQTRCPLASYGCGFSTTLWRPTYSSSFMEPEKALNLNLVFNPFIDSFGLTTAQLMSSVGTINNRKENRKRFTSFCSNSHTKTLLDLPYEILYEIIEYLDPFR